MMKSILIFAFFCAYFFSLNGQVLFPGQPNEEYYDDLKNRIVSFVPGEQQLIQAKAMPLPVTFMDRYPA